MTLGPTFASPCFSRKPKARVATTKIYGKFSKNFILIIVDGLGPNDMQVLFFFLKSTHNMYN